MTKNFLRNIIIGICVFIFAVIILYTAITLPDVLSGANSADSLINPDIPASARRASPSADVPLSPDQYYIARCTEDTISVYLRNGSREEFLYSISVRTEDISPEELSLLKKGIVLKDRQALASFEEDFSS